MVRIKTDKKIFMRSQFSAYLDTAITSLLYIVAGLTPLLFFNQTTEFYEIPKLSFLIAATVILLGLWIISWIVKGKVVILRTPLDIPLLVLLVAVLLSAYFSTSRFAVIYGNFPRVHGSAVAWVTYILLYFVTVSNLRSVNKIKGFLYTLYGSVSVVALVTLLSFFGVFLPFDFTRGVNFTPTGSSFSTIAFLLLLLPFPLLSLRNPNKYMPVPAALVMSSLFSIVIILIGSVGSYVVLFITLVICIVLKTGQKHALKNSFVLMFVPLALSVVFLVLAYLPMPMNKIQQLEASFPKEVQLPFAISWKVSVSSFRDSPFIGSGPSTYLFNFTNYKPLEFNSTRFWNFAFDNAHDEFLQILGTLGALGVFAITVLALTILSSVKKNLSLPSAHSQVETAHHQEEMVMQTVLQAFAVSSIVSVMLLIIHPTTLVSIVVTFFALAVFMASQKSIRERVTELSLGLKASTADNRQFDLLPVIIFIVFLVGAVPLLLRLFNIVFADYYHRMALVEANRNGKMTYDYLQKAETLNPYIDLYRVDMAQTNFALANAIATQKGPTAENPKGTLTDADRKTIQTLLSQAINEGRAAVGLSPLSSRNWEVLAAIYRNITGVAQNALAFSLDAYGRAIQRDPLNPVLRLNVGGIYYSVKNYDLAIRFFSDAANLKSDYANAYFNLSIALRDKGDLQNATAVAQRTVEVLAVNKNSNDYKAAVKLLDELKAKVAAAESANSKAPAAQPSSALQNEEIGNVNVNNLNQPPSVTPAPTVKPNPSSNLPQFTPAPTGQTTPAAPVE